MNTSITVEIQRLADNCAGCVSPDYSVPVIPREIKAASEGSVTATYGCPVCQRQWQTSWMLSALGVSEPDRLVPAGEIIGELLGSWASTHDWDDVVQARPLHMRVVRDPATVAAEAGDLLHQAAALIEQAQDLIEDAGYRADHVTIEPVIRTPVVADVIQDLAWIAQIARELPVTGQLHPLQPGQQTQRQIHAAHARGGWPVFDACEDIAGGAA